MCVERRKETGEVGLDTGIVRRKVLSCHLAFFEQEDRDRKSGVVTTCAAEKVTALYIANDSGLPKNVDPAIEIGEVVGGGCCFCVYIGTDSTYRDRTA